VTRYPFTALINKRILVTVHSPSYVRFLRLLDEQEQPAAFKLPQPVEQQLEIDFRPRASERAAAMILKALRSHSPTARNGYLAAAQLFALAAEKTP
jgi:hypothetical protein